MIDRRWSRFAWIGPGLIGVTAVVMAAWTWGTWPDVLVDFGQQLYLSWRISEGQVLYRDLAYYNGPLSLHANALLFLIFGVSLRVLVIANLVLLGGLLLLLYHAATIGGRWPAIMACLVYLTLFAFAQFVGIGNYNYICPYTHESTHGLLLCLAAIVLAWHAERLGVMGYLACGLVLGLAFLTKAEVFLAGVLGVGVAVAGSIWCRELTTQGVMRRAALLLIGLTVPPVAALSCLARYMTFDRALVGTLGSWVGTFNAQLLGQPFYRWCLGTDDVRGNLVLMAAWLGWYALLLVPAAALALLVRPASRAGRLIVTISVFTASSLLVVANPLGLEVLDAGRPLPVLVLLAGIAPALAVIRSRRQPARAELAMRQLSLVVFAFFLMSKMILNARLYHYGFVLAMPATLVLVVALLGWLPAIVDRAGGRGEFLLAATLALLLPGVAAHLRIQSGWIAGKAFRVGSGGDAFWADVRGRYVSGALRELSSRAGPGETLTAFPEGIMLNYLSRRIDPVPYTTFHTTELVLFGAGTIMDAIRSDPPDWVALVHKDTSELGYRFFGRDYARPLGRWIKEAYRPEVCVGAAPLQTDDFGILLLRRKTLRSDGGERGKTD